MRAIAREPAGALCAVSIDSSRKARVLHGPASSELTAHILAHDTLARHRPDDRVILHTHPTSITALSIGAAHRNLPGLLVRMHTEAPIVLQDALTALPFYAPGSLTLARATARALARRRAVIWYGHGIAVSAPALGAALDLIEVAEKCATIALLARATPGNRVGLSATQRRAVRRAFGLRP